MHLLRGAGGRGVVLGGGSGGGVENLVSIELHERLHTAVACCGKGNKSAATPASAP